VREEIGGESRPQRQGEDRVTSQITLNPKYIRVPQQAKFGKKFFVKFSSFFFFAF
jgi:hypothetical protein